MVQTRSKYRSLQKNQSSATSRELTQLQLPTLQTEKRKRKRNVDNNEDVTTIPIATVTTDKSVKHSKSNSDFIQAAAETCIVKPSHDRNKNNTSIDSKLELPSSSLPDLSVILSTEAVDEPLINNDEDDQHFTTSFFVLESNDSEDEHFDTNLHLQQQIMINTLNDQENNPTISESSDINGYASSSITDLSSLVDSWPIENNDLQWVKTKNGKDCLIMGGFSYIYMSESQKKNILNLRCQRRDVGCRAVVHLHLDTRLFINSNHVNHNHPPDTLRMKQKILNHKIENLINSEPTPVLKVIERVYTEANLTDEEQLNIRLPKAVGKV